MGARKLWFQGTGLRGWCMMVNCDGDGDGGDGGDDDGGDDDGGGPG